MQNIKHGSHIPALLFSKGPVSSSPQVATGPTKPVARPSLASGHPYSPVWPQLCSAGLLVIQPPAAGGLTPQPGLHLSPSEVSHGPGWGHPTGRTQGALTTAGATATGTLQLTGHLGRFNQREKPKISLKPPAAVCTRNASNSLSKRTKRQTGSKACAYSSLLQVFQVHKYMGRENKGIKQTKLVFTLF